MLKRWFLIVCIALVSLSTGVVIYGATIAKEAERPTACQREKQIVVKESKEKKAAPAAATTVKGNQSMEKTILALVNEQRAKAGKAPMEWNDRLYKVAAIRANEIGTKFSHVRPDGTSCFTAFNQAGAAYWYAAENIAAGQNSAESAMQAWMNSPGHKKNILGEGKSFACAVIKNPEGQGYYFVQEFGTLK